MVGTANMSTNAPSDSAVVNIKGTDKAINLTVDCNARYVYSDPEVGCAIAVAEAARNITCTGGEPVAITNCLNFGNPYNPEVYWQFVSAIKGMSVACTKFETPVTGGNVSFYNQSSDEGPVFPTPTIGMLGVMDSKEFRTTLDFKHVGDSIFLIGESKNDICSSEYLTSFHGVKSSPAPFFDLDKEYDTHQVIKGLIHNKLIQSAHDVSDGGLFVTLLESAMPNHFGFAIESDDSVRKDAFLFGEAQGRIVVSVAKEQHESFIEYMSLNEIEYNNLGEVTSSEIKVDDESFENIDTYTYRYEHALEEIIEKQ
jgi:phosphoribosylformylglycinamidine synthase